MMAGITVATAKSRSTFDRVLFAVCVLLIAGSGTIPPKVGACGTAHSLLVQIVSLTGVGSIQVALHLGKLGRAEALVILAVANATLFFIPAFILFKQAPRVIYP